MEGERKSLRMSFFFYDDLIKAEGVQMLAIDRLSKKGSKERRTVEEEVDDEAKDLEALLEGEKDYQAGAGQINGLQELLIRLKLGYGAEEIRKGRWDEEI